MAFVSLNAFAVYAHHDDDVFHMFYPFPFALDVGRGPSMLPTIGCGLGDDDDDDGGNVYLRDCWSHRFVWFDLNHLKDHCAMCIFRMPRGGGGRGGGGEGGGEGEDNNHVRSSAPSSSSSSSLSRPWHRGDVVTLYNKMTNSTVTKRIVGVGGDAVRACGEYSSEYYDAAIAVEDGGGTDDIDDNRLIRRGGANDDDRVEAETTRRAGVPHDPRFPIPFCQSILSSTKWRNDDARRSGGDRVEGGGASSSAALFVVPPDHVWLEGDNPPRSTDSRHYGPVPASSLRGRVVLRLWPVERAGYRRGAAVDPERPAPPLP